MASSRGPSQPRDRTQVSRIYTLPHLAEEMATHSSIFAWEIPWTEELSRLQSMGHKESGTIE